LYTSLRATAVRRRDLALLGKTWWYTFRKTIPLLWERFSGARSVPLRPFEEMQSGSDDPGGRRDALIVAAP
jgi:hypothetical protein